MISNKQFTTFANDPAAFRDSLTVDVSGVARKFGDVQDDWQRADFVANDPALMRCVGRSDTEAIMWSYLERARGHSKTTDIAVMCVWALAFATRPIRGYAFAADKDQSRLLKDAIATIIRLNPWLSEILDINAHSISNGANGHPAEGAELIIAASDVGSSYGILPDLIVADELTHWEEGAEGLWESIISSAEKRKNCMLMVISNAGFLETWQWQAREKARTAPEDWIFSRLDGVKASWYDAKAFERQRRNMPPIAFARLWENQWSTGGGDALTPDDINAAFSNDVTKINGAQDGWEYVAGLDLGIKRDCSAIVILGVKRTYEGHGQIRLAHTRLWRPRPGVHIQIADVERAILALHGRFNLQCLNCDPWNATYLMQRLQATGMGDISHDAGTYGWRKVPIVEVPQTGSTLQKMATVVVEAFTDRRVVLYDDPDLRRDLFKLRIEDKPYGFRLKSPHDSDGHGDLASAFALAMLAASDMTGTTIGEVGAIDLDRPSKQTVFEQMLAEPSEMQKLLEYEEELRNRPDDTFNQWRAIASAVNGYTYRG